MFNFNSKKNVYSHDLSGTDRPAIKEFPIASATVIERGEKVMLSGGKIVASDEDSAAIGISADPHDGSSDGQKGTTIRVYCSPTAVIECIPACSIEADSGSTTNSFVDATLDDHADDAFNGGHLKVVSATNLVAGKVVEITDFNGTTGALATAGGEVFAEGDTAILFPPVGSLVMGIDSDGTNLDLKSAGTSVMITEVDLVEEKVYYVLYKHQLAGAMS